MRIVGVDIGGTAIKLGVFDQNGKSHLEKAYPTKGHLGGQKVLENMIDQLEQLPSFNAIGISSAGQIDPRRGVFLGSVNIPGLEGMAVQSMLEEHFHVPVAIENDVNAAALGEKTFGVGAQLTDYLFLTYGTGVGGAIMADSKLYYGGNAFAGEFGHMITHAYGEQCNCGLQGCYERYASTTALVREAAKVNATFKNGKVLFEAWHRGDAIAIKVVADWVEEIVIGLINLVHIFNPSTIIIGGGVMEQDVLIEMIQEKVNTAIMPSFRKVTLVKASLGNKAGMLGAISLHL